MANPYMRDALLEQMKSNQPVGKLLVSLGFVSEATLRDALSESLGKQSVDLANAIIDPSALHLVPRELAKRHHLLPLDYDAEHHRLTVAISDINDIVALDRVRGEDVAWIEIEGEALRGALVCATIPDDLLHEGQARPRDQREEIIGQRHAAVRPCLVHADVDPHRAARLQNAHGFVQCKL